MDGLRFFAFLAVFISHAALFLGLESGNGAFSVFKTYVLANGDIGVSFFFVLSGFLITYILLQEKRAYSSVSLRKFYMRRVLRIWPVYFITLALGFFILPWLTHVLIGDASLPFLTNVHLSELPKYLFFLANFSLAFHGGASVLTDVLWSISVEEQFYLVWPFVVAFLPTKHLPKVLGVLIVISSVYKYLYAFDSNVIAYSTFSVMSDLCMGCLLGYVAVERKNLYEKWKSLPRYSISLSYAAIFALVVSRHWYLPVLYPYKVLYPLVVLLAPLALAVLFSLVIYEQNESHNSFFKIGRSKAVTHLGKISYGLYSYHMVAFAIALSLAAGLSVGLSYSSFVLWLGFCLATLFVTFALAYFSFKYIETWFQNKKPL